jgi:hypothetical protein
MIELDQTPRRTGTTKTIEETEAPKEDETGMLVADHRFTQLPITHLGGMTEMKAELSPSTGKPEFPIDFPALQDVFYPFSCPTSSNLIIILSMMAR